MKNLSQIKRERLLRFLSELRESHKDDAQFLVAINEVEDEIISKKYGLVWERHVEEVDSRMEKEIPVFIEDRQRNLCTTNGKYNFLLEGDNLHSLLLLKKTHFAKIDVIYIDPPYNRGKDDFVYNDDYIASEDGYFHSKWISFMYERLKIAYELLAPHGTIFISIDDNELANLKLICDELFCQKPGNFLGLIHWRRRSNQPNDKTKLIGLVGEHILAYTKDIDALKKVGIGKVGITGKFSNPDDDPRGPWASKPWKTGSAQSGTRYIITTPTGRTYNETWMGSEETFKELLADGRILFPNNGDGSPRKKYYKSERIEEGQCATNWWNWEDFGSNNNATDELKLWFDGVCPFDNPKPVELISAIIKLGCVKDDAIVLDFFAGSGTTAEAVHKANEDGGHRTFILCTNNEINGARRVDYLHSQGLMLDYVPTKKTAEQTILNKIRKFFENNEDGFKRHFLEPNPELEEFGICRSITYRRVKSVITGKTISGNTVAEPGNFNLKYYHTGFVYKNDSSLVEKLLERTIEMIQLENSLDVDDNNYPVVLTDHDADLLQQRWSSVQETIKVIFISRKVLLTSKQRSLFNSIPIVEVPDYFFSKELREVGEY